RKSVQARAAAPRGLAPARRPTKAEQADKGVDNTVTRGATNADYLTARIARDRPDVLEEMQAGVYPSVRAAAREAGLVKARWSVPAHDIPALAAYLYARLGPLERAELARRLLRPAREETA